MSAASSEGLFQPLRVGECALRHRVALAPLTRLRADDAHVPTDMMVEYYRQRGSTPGTLLITEATFIAAKAGGYANVPGIWSADQVAGWKTVVEAVHEKGSFIYLQLWALGRTTNAEQLAVDAPGEDVVSSGDVQLDDKHVKPRPLSLEEIDEYVELYAKAAENAVRGAGFDGVEIHGANGYLIDQFNQDVSNNRTDIYGGSIENRIRFALRVTDAVVARVGSSRTAIRLSPYERFQGMRMADPVPTFSRLISELTTRDLAYLHVTEPRVASLIGVAPAPGEKENPEGESLDFARKIWAPRPIVLAGGYTRESALKRFEEGASNKENIVIAFGRHFISNPDLPMRLRHGVASTPYDRTTFYTAKQAAGYIDYAFAEDIPKDTL